MATVDNTNNLIQKYASIGIPGAWITDDDLIDPTIIKIGGFAKYFFLWQKSKEQIYCLSCKKKMYLLTQINAPLYEEQCQRNIYVFMCCNHKCTKTSKGWKVIVHKGGKINKYSNYNNNNNNNDNNNNNNNNNNNIHTLIKHNNKKSINKIITCETFWNKNLNENTIINKEKHNEMEHKLDGLNDDFAKLMAIQQQLLNEVDKQNKTHKSNKKGKKKSSNKKQTKMIAKKGSFIPFQIACHNENYYKNVIKNKTNKSDKIVKWNNKEIDVKKLMDLVSKDDIKCDDENDDLEDDLLSDYLDRISYEKTQCIRYCYGDYPLLPYKLDLKKIPNCKHCGNKMVFELQIMSPVLNYLEPKQLNHEWLTVLIFACPLTCQPSSQQHVIVCCEQ